MTRGMAALSGLALIALLTGCNPLAGNSTTPASTDTNQTDTAPVVGKMAPSFTLPTMNNQGQMTLKDILAKHQPVVLNAWASWCGPCNEEAPDFVHASEKYQGKVLFVGVNMTKTEMAVSDAEKFVDKYKIPYILLKDPNGDFMNTYGTAAFPTTYVLSATGKILSVHQGMLSEAALDQLLQQALQSGSTK